MRSTILYLFLAFTILNCTNNDQAQNTIKDALITKMLKTPSLSSVKNSQGQLIIYKNEFCENFDCANFFKKYENEVIFYAKEDLFMRGIRNYVEILEISEGQKQINLTKVTGREGRSVRIQL